MTPDHYATLGVTPTAEPAVIRAAYLALMREYHPDRNASPAAALRAQAIIAAFKVLGDFDRRNEYDWDRRRAREAAEAQATKRPRRTGAAAIAAAAIGLAAVGAYSLMPAPRPGPGPVPPPVAEARQAPAAKARTMPRPGPPRERPAAAVRVERPAPMEPRAAPLQVARLEPVARIEAVPGAKKIEPVQAARIVRAGPEKAERAPLAVRPAAVKLPAPRAAPVAAGTDLASLDQFVMSFYGQSWRYGDPPRRAALERTRAGFVARRGACTADKCKRAAYLKLMRDVSEIVETGKPGTR